tara:strand:+ start:1190 stop:1678 length:489 start_codon:yes stop_codon:yes gene_type:complete
MKKTITTVLMLVIAISSFAQLKINKTVDEMTDKESYLTNERFLATNPEKNKGCAIDMVIDVVNNVKISNYMFVQMIGIESCNENNILIMLFENGEKLSIKSWNKFNCKGNAYFSLSKENVNMLKTNILDKVRITNGYSHNSYTAEIDYKTYFIEFYKLLNQT